MHRHPAKHCCHVNIQMQIICSIPRRLTRVRSRHFKLTAQQLRWQTFVGQQRDISPNETTSDVPSSSTTKQIRLFKPLDLNTACLSFRQFIFCPLQEPRISWDSAGDPLAVDGESNLIQRDHGPSRILTIRNILRDNVDHDCFIANMYDGGTKSRQVQWPLETPWFSMLPLEPYKMAKAFRKPKELPNWETEIDLLTKEIHVTMSASVWVWREHLRLIWNLLVAGLNVEVHVHRTNHKKFRKTKQQESSTKDASFLEAWLGVPHLWPVVMLNALPKGTRIVVHPVTNHWEVAWVLVLDQRPDRGFIPVDDNKESWSLTIRKSESAEGRLMEKLERTVLPTDKLAESLEANAAEAKMRQRKVLKAEKQLSAMERLERLRERYPEEEKWTESQQKAFRQARREAKSGPLVHKSPLSLEQIPQDSNCGNMMNLKRRPSFGLSYRPQKNSLEYASRIFVRDPVTGKFSTDGINVDD